MFFKKVVFVVGILSVMSGCATTATKEAGDEIKKNKGVVSVLGKDMDSQIATIKEVNDLNRIWVSGKEVSYSKDENKKATWMNSAPVVFNQGSIDIKEASAYIKMAYPKITIDIDDDILGSSGSSDSNASEGGSEDSTSSSSASGNSGTETTYVDFNYSGMLSGLLDKISKDGDFYWIIDRKDSNKVILKRFVTKSFRLDLLSGNVNYSSGLSIGASSSSGSSSRSSSSSSSSSSSGGGAGSATMESTYDSSSDLMTESINNIINLISPKGSSVVNKTMGIVTVTDSPFYIKKIESLVDKLNQDLSSQIMINVSVYSLKDTKSDGYGINWNAFYSSISGKFNIALATASPSIGVDAAKLTTTILTPSSPWAGTNSIVEALSTLGNISIVTSTRAVTVNGIAIPISQSNSISYIASATPTTVDRNGTTVPGSIVPAKVNTGFNMLVTPKIINNGNVLLQFSIDMSELTRLVSRTTGGVTVQTPEVSRNTFLQRAIIKSGQTLVMTGFNKKVSTKDLNGLGSPENWVMGGNKKAKVTDEYLVLVVTPRIVAIGR